LGGKKKRLRGREKRASGGSLDLTILWGKQLNGRIQKMWKAGGRQVKSRVDSTGSTFLGRRGKAGESGVVMGEKVCGRGKEKLATTRLYVDWGAVFT